MNIAILAVEYLETSYQQTRQSIRDMQKRYPDISVNWTGRDGVGSLAKALNDGFTRLDLGRFDYVWMITNITFNPHQVLQLATVAAQNCWVGTSPAFKSDHSFLRANSIECGRGNVEVPFVEFTAAMVHGPTFANFALDESMPYVGHDLDWSYRVKQAGWKVGVAREVEIGHAYLRNLPAQSTTVTAERTRLRQLAEAPTQDALEKKHGTNWREKLYYKGAI